MIANEDNWGCVVSSRLFTSPGQIPSLNNLVKQILKEKTDRSKCDEIIEDDRPFPISNSNEWNVAQPVVYDTSSGGSVSPTGSTTGSKKILKHKKGLVEKVPNLKRVTFEVEKFVVDSIRNNEERLSAETQLAIRLGAKPKKRLATNYKKLKINVSSAKV